MDDIFTLDMISSRDVCPKCICLFFFGEIVMVMINSEIMQLN